MKKITYIMLVCILLSSCGKVDEVSQKVMTDIDSIGAVELSDQELIEKIEKTYATLTDKQKEQVDNYAVLLTARDELDILIKEAEEKRIAQEKADEEARIAEEKAAEEERKKLYTHSVKYCAKAIITLKSDLKDPESLDIHAFHYSDTDGIEYVGIDASAKNGLGGVNRKCYLVTDSTELVSGGLPNLDTLMYCVENDYITSDSISLFDKYDDVDSEIVYQLLADYEETGDMSLLR